MQFGHPHDNLFIQFLFVFQIPLRHSMPWYMMTLQESLEPASALPQTRRLINCNKKSSSMTRRIRRKKIIMKFSHMSLVLVFLLHGLGGSMSSQDAAKLTVNFGKLIRHSLGYGNTGCRVFKWGVQNWKYFCLRINLPKGNYWILRIGVVGMCQNVPKYFW